MTAMDYSILVGTGIIALLVGFFFGLMPLKTDLMTPSQRTWSQVASLAGIGLIVILILIGKDMASWIGIGAMILGLLIGIIPPIKKTMCSHFSWLMPRTEEPGNKGKGKRPRKTRKQG